MKQFFNALLCALGFHEWRTRQNGKATERVCMRRGCEKKEKFYTLENGSFGMFMGKKIPMKRHTFYKRVKS